MAKKYSFFMVLIDLPFYSLFLGYQVTQQNKVMLPSEGLKISIEYWICLFKNRHERWECSEFQYFHLIQKPSRDVFKTQAVGQSHREQHVLLSLYILNKLRRCQTDSKYINTFHFNFIYFNRYSYFIVMNLK